MSFAHATAPIAYQLPLSYDNPSSQPVEQVGERYSVRTRTALIVGAGAGLWAVILGVGYVVVRALI